MGNLLKLSNLIEEDNYPYFEENYLLDELARIGIEDGVTLESIARDLCLIKAGIEEIKLGDIIIPSPRKHFLMLASGFRSNHTGVVVRADER